ncbi:MAG TPA: hypothetical protein PKD32_12230 [Saprospiraceae bacterium]|nr:hypothetical protein [Saprospiraceae bacterium]
MFEYSNLSKVTLAELVAVFNQCFKDYFIVIKMDEELLRRKISLEDIDLQYSIGGFYEKKLVAFVLHGKRVDILYNAGTGVLPQFRGNKITYQMYQYFFSLELCKHISHIELEVIDKNSVAINNYLNIGFNQTDTLHCFSLTLNEHFGIRNVIVSESKVLTHLNSEQYFDTIPLWQNNILSKAAAFDYLKFIIATKNDKIVSYALFNTLNNRLLQIGTHFDYRRQKFAGSLLHFIAQSYDKNISIINVSETNTSLFRFLKKQNATCTLTQYQMIKKINHERNNY